jgi:hypothetical protein
VQLHYPAVVWSTRVCRRFGRRGGAAALRVQTLPHLVQAAVPLSLTMRLHCNAACSSSSNSCTIFSQLFSQRSKLLHAPAKSIRSVHCNSFFVQTRQWAPWRPQPCVLPAPSIKHPTPHTPGTVSVCKATAVAPGELVGATLCISNLSDTDISRAQAATSPDARPYMLLLPDLDGVGATSSRIWPTLATELDLRVLRIGPDYRGSFADLVEFVAVSDHEVGQRARHTECSRVLLI